MQAAAAFAAAKKGWLYQSVQWRGGARDGKNRRGEKGMK
jgi:hypothetical protein